MMRDPMAPWVFLAVVLIALAWIAGRYFPPRPDAPGDATGRAPGPRQVDPTPSAGEVPGGALGDAPSGTAPGDQIAADFEAWLDAGRPQVWPQPPVVPGRSES